MKWYLDESMSQVVASNLRAMGIDAVSSHEVGMDGQSDEEQFAFAVSEGRVMVTYDTDFFELANQYYKRVRHFPGLAFVPASRIAQADLVGQARAIARIDSSGMQPNQVIFLN